MIRRCAALLVLCLWPAAALAVSCEDVEFEGAGYTICSVDPARETLELFLRDDAGEIYGQFLNIERDLARAGKTLAFAMNAGMYHEDRAPVGHYIEDGKEVMRVISNPGPGNFGLLPNGVFCLQPGRALVIETLDYLAQETACDHATQSGPMLVIEGELHPRFLADSTSVYVRNGVGTTADGTRAVFAISNEPVNFYSFGRLFRDYLGLPNALYFDGSVSRLYAPGLDRSDFGFALGPIVGVVQDR